MRVALQAAARDADEIEQPGGPVLRLGPAKLAGASG